MINITFLTSQQSILRSIMLSAVFFCSLNSAYAQKSTVQSDSSNNKHILSAHSVGKASPSDRVTDLHSEKRAKGTPVTQGKTREEHLKLKKQIASGQLTTSSKVLGAASNDHSVSSTYLHSNTSSSPHVNNEYYSTDFGIYRAFSYLLDDIDGDGFYQSFSIVFDADFYYAEYANVYAELYVRKDGGSWIHYYSTDIFTIYGESEDDEFEVTTTLEQGFNNEFYDVLIDLYDANSDTLLVSYSSDDSDALYGLALESREYDAAYISEIVYSHGGSYSLFTLIVVFFIMLMRIKKAKTIE